MHLHDNARVLVHCCFLFYFYPAAEWPGIIIYFFCIRENAHVCEESAAFECIIYTPSPKVTFTLHCDGGTLKRATV